MSRSKIIYRRYLEEKEDEEWEEERNKKKGKISWKDMTPEQRKKQTKEDLRDLENQRDYERSGR